MSPAGVLLRGMEGEEGSVVDENIKANQYGKRGGKRRGRFLTEALLLWLFDARFCLLIKAVDSVYPDL